MVSVFFYVISNQRGRAAGMRFWRVCSCRWRRFPFLQSESLALWFWGLFLGSVSQEPYWVHACHVANCLDNALWHKIFAFKTTNKKSSESWYNKLSETLHFSVLIFSLLRLATLWTKSMSEREKHDHLRVLLKICPSYNTNLETGPENAQCVTKRG